MQNSKIVLCGNCGTENRVSTIEKRLPICGRCRNPLTLNNSPLILTDANFQMETENSSLPFLVDFWAAWCGPCRMIAPIVEQLAKELNGKALIGKLDVDQNQQTAARFRVQSIPTLLILKEGKEIDRIVGAQSKEAILRRMQQFM